MICRRAYTLINKTSLLIITLQYLSLFSKTILRFCQKKCSPGPINDPALILPIWTLHPPSNCRTQSPQLLAIYLLIIVHNQFLQVRLFVKQRKLAWEWLFPRILSRRAIRKTWGRRTCFLEQLLLDTGRHSTSIVLRQLDVALGSIRRHLLQLIRHSVHSCWHAGCAPYGRPNGSKVLVHQCPLFLLDDIIVMIWRAN